MNKHGIAEKAERKGPAKIAHSFINDAEITAPQGSTKRLTNREARVKMKKFVTLFNALALLVCLCACKDTVARWQEQYDLGARYLSNGEYEEAILAFAAAIEIDPKQVGAYEKLADVYIALGDYEQAAQILLSAIENCPDSRVSLLERLEQIGYTIDESGSLFPYTIPDINFEHFGSGLDIDGEYAVITATNMTGDPVWQYTTQTFENTELPRVEEIGVANGVYYFNESGTIVALDLRTGKTVWKNSDFGGASISFAFDESGNLFLAGYYGPNFFWVDAEGKTVKRIDTVDARYHWPVSVRCHDRIVEITMHGTSGDGSEGNEHIVTVDLNQILYEDNSSWHRAYLEYILNGAGGVSRYGGLQEAKFQLIYVDDDNVPELWINGSSMADGSQICTFDGQQVNSIFISEYGNLQYIERSGYFYTAGGHMDVYWDGVYRVQNGQFVDIARGDFGAQDNAHVQFDENGEPIYQYSWNGISTTKQAYQENLNRVFDFSAAQDIFDEVPYNFYSLQQQLTD